MVSRGRLRAFWLATWLLTGLVGGVFGSGGRVRRGGVIAGSIFVAGVVPGLVRPELGRWPYLTWDKGARRVSQWATVYAAWVTHLTATAPMDPAALDAVPGHPLGLPSRWSRRGGAPTISGQPQADDAFTRLEQGAPLRTVYRWVRATERPRGRWLVVCLAIMRWLQTPRNDDEHGPAHADTYTLY